MNRALFVLPLLTLAILAGFFGWSLLSGRDPASIGSVMIGRPAPTLPGQLGDGLIKAGNSIAETGTDWYLAGDAAERKAFAFEAKLGMELRHPNLVRVIEFVKDRDDRVFFDPSLKVGPQIATALAASGVIGRAMPQGDILGFAPPLCLTREEADIVVAKLEALGLQYPRVTGDAAALLKQFRQQLESE